MSATAIPPFPTDVVVHPLLIVDYPLIQAGDGAEIDKLWNAATTIGVWYLKNHAVDHEVNQMFMMGSETMNLPLDEKMKYEQGDDGMSFGYKAVGANATDEHGSPDTVEFINIAKDDVLAWPKQARRDYPTTVYSYMQSTILPFVQKSLAINLTLLKVFNAKLGLPEGALARRHSLEEHSGSEARYTRSPSKPEGTSPTVIGAHSDFGSLTVLHNRLGGLQVLVQGTDSWQYVKPLPGHAICNIGDAMALFSGGILRSNVHRVVPPPGEQAKFERRSLAYFVRPGDSVPLRALVDESPFIAEAVARTPEKTYETSATSYEWFTRRIKNQRIKNRMGPETWLASRGTESLSL